ncbi:DUF3040 domain-containing protein [Pseudonocardia sp. H11422]|uniref:DUF3040 domain-containing protein n=1 Tax=Pseudonocardia sp. H11422 TaxID=2835866 RepID=UPI001BDC4219|nr:DUF3040 domain-containing protein [Pseudonocardia sp. H11422]
MTLSERERRELHSIEQALIISDPGLATALRLFTDDRCTPLATITAGVFVTVAVLLLALGLLLHDSSLSLGSCLVAAAAPIVVLLVAATRWDRTRP